MIEVPDTTVGIKLYRLKGEHLIACEAVRLVRGAHGVQTVLMRAQIIGRVEIGGKINDHFADLLDDDYSITETVALDAKSYGELKRRQLKVKIEAAQPPPGGKG